MRKTKGRLPNVAIRASAGSGKTYALSLRYIELLASGAPPEEILTVTFTRKAAGEILRRIVGRLAECVLSADALGALAKDLKRPRLTQAEVERWFDAMTLHLDRLRIGTLDGFFAKTCQKHPFQLGLAPGWTIVEGAEETALRSAAIADLMETGDPKYWVELSRLLSKGDVERDIHRQVDTTVDQLHEIFTESLAEAWTVIRGGALLEEKDLRDAIARIHQLSLPAAFGKGHTSDLKNLDARDWDKLVTQGLSAALADGSHIFNRKEIPSEVVDAYQPVMEHVRAFFRQRVARQLEAAHRILTDFDVCFRQLQTRSGIYRFSDVTRSLLPEMAADAGIEHSPAIRHLLLDEFQDTSRVQWAAMAELAESCKDEGTFYCVGDPKQAIYRWRGGAAELFDILDDFVGPLEWGELSKNYRSSQVVLDAVHVVFSNLCGNAALKDLDGVGEAWSRTFPRHEASEDRPGFVQLRTAPDMDAFPDANAVLRFAASEVARLHREHPAASIGVLTRKNAPMARVFHELRQLDVAASKEGGNPLSNSPAVGLVLSLFDWLDHPGDTASLFHVVHSVLGRRLWGDSEVPLADRAAQMRRELVERGYALVVRDLVLLLQPGLNETEQDRLDQLLELTIQFEPMATLRPSDFVEFVESTKVEDPKAAGVRVMTVHQAKGLEFDIVVLCELDGPLKGPHDSVIVGRNGPDQPIHTVCRYVSQDVLHLFPPSLQKIFAEHWESVVRESLCLLYVAMTRARHALHMILAPSKPNEKTMPGSYGGLLRCAFVGERPVPPDAVLFQNGDPDWYSRLDWKSTGRSSNIVTIQPATWQTPTADASTVVADVEGESSSGARSFPITASAPSRQHHLGPGHWQKRFELDEADSLVRGSILHFWYSRIEWLETGTPSDADLFQLLPPRVKAPEDLASLVRDFRRSLEAPPIDRLFRRPDGSEEKCRIWRERPFAIRLDDKLVTGIFDRVELHREDGVLQRAVVIDFKTDRLKSAGATRQRAKVYEPQLQLYRSALAKMLRLDLNRIDAQIVFVDVGEIVHI